MSQSSTLATTPLGFDLKNKPILILFGHYFLAKHNHANATPTILTRPRRRPSCNDYQRRKWNQLLVFKSWTMQFVFLFVLMPVRKALIHLFSLKLLVNSWADHKTATRCFLKFRTACKNLNDQAKSDRIKTVDSETPSHRGDQSKRRKTLNSHHLYSSNKLTLNPIPTVMDGLDKYIHARFFPELIFHFNCKIRGCEGL